MGALDGPLPLVTMTLTTDEMAMASAGLILLRRLWVQRQIDIANSGGDVEVAEKTIGAISLFIQRLDESVTEEQGRALLTELINELKRRSNG